MRLVLAFSALLAATVAAAAQTPSWLPPPDNARCPSKWGAGDERGAANHMKPQTVLNAAKLIKTGEVIELGHELKSSMPLSPGRVYDMQVKRTAVGTEANKRNGNEEIMMAEMGQVGTQFDGFAHQTHDNSHYNCFKTEDIATRNGFTKLGIQNVGMLMTRGVLIDVAGFKGVDILPDTYEITVADLEGAIKKQNLTFQPGDAIIIHTGWGKLWDKEPARYAQGQSRHRREGRRIPDRQGSDAARRRHRAGRGVAQPGQADLAADPPDGAGGQRRASPREPQARRARGEERLGIRPGGAAAQAVGRHRLDGGAGGAPVRRATRHRGARPRAPRTARPR